MAAASSTNGLWGTIQRNEDGSRVTSDTKSRNVSNDLDKNAFLKLLMTQMQYQDPLNPTDDKQFLAQMAQFSALEQMQNMSATVTEASTFSLIGKKVDCISYNETTYNYEQVTGVVSSVLKSGSDLYLRIGDKDVLASSVVEVYPDTASSDISSLSNSALASSNIALIGKYVQALIVDGKEVKEFVEGIVDHVKFDADGNPVLVVDGKEVYGAEVISVADKGLLLNKKILCEELDEDGENVTVERTIDSVTFKDNKAYLVLGDKTIEINKINYVSEALGYVGKSINSGGEAVKVDGVMIIDGAPYFKIGDSVLSYTTYKGIS